MNTSRKWKVQQNFFHHVETEAQAYFLGFLMADGNVYENTISIKIKRQDEAVLEQFREVLLSDCPILEADKGTVRLRIHSRQMAQDLARYGVVPKKSFIAAPPSLDPKLKRHFWRGAVDGDGTVWSTYSSKKITLYGSDQMVTGFKNYCEQFIEKDIPIRPRKSIWTYTVTNKSALAIAIALYEGATFYLPRKYETFQDMQNFYLAYDAHKHSTYKGVTWYKTKNKWQSQIRVENRTIHLGYFDDEQKAAKAYDAFVQEKHLSRRTNF